MGMVGRRTPREQPLQMIAAGGRLKTAMDRQGLNVNQLATASGISASTIYHFLHGRREMHLKDLHALGNLLRVSPSWIAWGK
jgi:transcriptional regulator with XRE-family HTH domain